MPSTASASVFQLHLTLFACARKSSGIFMRWSPEHYKDGMFPVQSPPVLGICTKALCIKGRWNLVKSMSHDAGSRKRVKLFGKKTQKTSWTSQCEINLDASKFSPMSSSSAGGLCVLWPWVVGSHCDMKQINLAWPKKWEDWEWTPACRGALRVTLPSVQEETGLL